MKSTGMVRRIDAVGRFVIPIEMRNLLGIDVNDLLEIFTEDDKVILKKYQPSCIFCKSSDDLIMFRDKLVCRACLRDIPKQ